MATCWLAAALSSASEPLEPAEKENPCSATPFLNHSTVSTAGASLNVAEGAVIWSVKRVPPLQ